jgi:hypothetical protein
MLERSRQSGGSENITEGIRDDLKSRLKTLRDTKNKADPSGLFRLSDELIVARWLAAKKSSDVSDLEGGQA